MDVPIIPVLEYYGVEVRNPNRLETIVCCPVHQENVPSCTVNTEKNVMSCKACGFAGDALSLIMEKEGVGFAASIRVAEGIVGEIRRDVSRPARRRSSGVSGRQGAWKPRFRQAPPRRGARPDQG